MNGRIATIGIVVVLALSLPAGLRADEEPPDALEVLQKSERVFERLAGSIRPAVVNIRRFTKDAAWWEKVRPERRGAAGWRVVPTTDLLYPGHRPARGASGFLVSADGYIVTLRRLVVDPATGREAPIVDVEVGQDHYQAEVMGLEPTLDLAVLKITSNSPLPFLRFGDSGKSRPGHWAIAFGNPDGSEQTLLPGFVSFQPTRECYQDDLSATYLQTSVAVGDGSLGGPVVNLRGEVIGVSARLGRPTTSATPAPVTTGSGHALPSNIANAILQSLLIRENKESPWLGVSVLALTDEERARLGDRVTGGISIDNVFDPSPASAAGILVGDLLLRVAGEPIATVYDFQRLLYHHGPGSRVTLAILRDGKPLEFVVTIARRPPEATTR